jgi:hypothetical protein
MSKDESKGRVVRVERAIASVEPSQWEACANPPSRPYNPFVSHSFLKALEDSGSVAPETGWLPQHLVLEDADGAVAGCMPCYLKSHSQGEYVFDYGWAAAFEAAGGEYYPKLQCSVPFTPVTGRRLLVADGAETEHHELLLASAAVQLTRKLDASSLHLTFLTEGEWAQLGELGMLRRTDQQFHWINNGYGSFSDFLGELSSRKRKAVKKERHGACADGIEIEWLTGSEITEAHWDTFFDFYLDTGERKWGSPYLNREFFSLVGETMGRDILLIMCRSGGRYIAGALNFIGGDALYGRYWGCIEDHRFLHFETCYYQAIDFAIAHGLKCVEAGAQGEHKLARGYLPITTYSAHFIANQGLSAAVSDYLDQERQAVARENEILRTHSPFRSTFAP